MADIDREQGAPIPVTMVTKYKDMGDGTHALQVYTPPVAGERQEVDVRTITEAAWATLLNDVVFDGTPAVQNSSSHNISGQSGLWVQLYIESTGAPTTVRIIAQYSHNNGANWFDFVEGLWASLYYEDTATATPGIRHAFLLPCGGQDLVRFRVVTAGTGVGATFTVGIRVRAFRGNLLGAHA